MANRQVWWYAKAGEKHGPMSGRELKALAAAGGIGPRDKVWKVGLPRWVDASVVRGLLPPAVGGASGAASASPEVSSATSATPVVDQATSGAEAPAQPPRAPRSRSRSKPASKSEAAPAVATGPATTADAEMMNLPGGPVRHKGPEQIVESKTGTPWSPTRVPAGITSRASTISLGVPEDLLRAFVGSAYDRFYRSRWHAPLPDAAAGMRRVWASLNWAAAGGTLFWVGYRKMYLHLLVTLLLLLPPAFLLEWGVATGASLLLYPVASLVFLLRANDWYFEHARKRIRQITDLGLPAEMTQQKLARAGGTSWLPSLAAFLGVVLVMVLAGMVLGLGPVLLMMRL